MRRLRRVIVQVGAGAAARILDEVLFKVVGGYQVRDIAGTDDADANQVEMRLIVGEGVEGIACSAKVEADPLIVARLAPDNYVVAVVWTREERSGNLVVVKHTVRNKMVTAKQVSALIFILAECASRYHAKGTDCGS